MNIEQLRAALPNVPATRRDFAQSLIAYFEVHNRWSARQQFFVDQIVEQARQSAQSTLPGTGSPAPLNAEGCATVLRWFARNRERNPTGRRVRVTFPRASVGAGLRLSSPSRTSAYSADNTFFIHRDGLYVGRVTDGQLIARDATAATTLAAVLADPLAATISAGRATGTCCFCARELTDTRSVSVGYGPICADHYGLPWGDTEPRTVSRPGEYNPDTGGFNVITEQVTGGHETIDVTAIGDATRRLVAGLPRAAEAAAQTASSLRQVAAQVAVVGSNVAPVLSRAAHDVLRRRSEPHSIPAPPRRPDLPSYENGGPDDEDREFM